MQYHVRISGDDLVFSAAHFILLEGNVCESLHGHNYRVAAEVHGPLDEQQCVVDFHVLREALKKIIGQLDHAVLIPTENPALSVTAGGNEVEVTLADRRWVFPRSDCRLLPLAATTAELLAHYIARQLGDELHARTGQRPERLRVEVEESAGQAAICEWASAV